MLRALALVPFIAMPILALGQETPSFTPDDAEAMTACIDALHAPEGEEDVLFRPRADCIGAAFDACTAEPGGDTTVGMRACFARETDWWDSQLNADYAMLRETLDADLAEALQDVQRAWIGWRDTNCRFAFDLAGEGTLSLLVLDDCILNETARRAETLSGYLAGNP